MSIIIFILLGAFVGWVASLLTHRDAEQGWLANILVGIVGSFLGSLFSNLITGRDQSYLTFDWTSLFWSLVGAVVLCLVLNQVQRGRLR